LPECRTTFFSGGVGSRPQIKFCFNS